MSDQITELLELDATAVSGVTSPANGASWLVLKAAASEGEECSTCKGSGTILAGKRKCPDCAGAGKVSKSDSPEADEQEDEMTKEQAEQWAGAFCGDGNCEVCVIKDADGTRFRATKALSESDRKKMPASAFAFIDKNGGKHLPVHDAAHAKAALGRFDQQDFSEAKGDPADAKKKAASKIKAAAKKHGVDVSEDSNVAQAAKGAIQDALNGTAEPKAASTLDGSKSGVAGSATAGVIDRPAQQVVGGEPSYAIPLDEKTRDNPPAPDSTDAAGIVASIAKTVQEFSALVKARAEKDAKVLSMTPPQGDAAMTPGSPAWEAHDAATLQQVGDSLASCCQAIACIAERERTEGQVADPGDMANAWDLEEAEQALDYALGVVARLSFHENAEEQAAKAGRVLSGKNVQALSAARDHLQAVIDGAQGKPASADDSTEENDIMSAVTKEDLVEAFTAGSAAVATAVAKQILDAEEARRKAKKEAKAEKENAIEAGKPAESSPKGHLDADNPGGIAGGGDVKAEFVNKETEGEVTLDSLAKQVGDLAEIVGRIASRPRLGGPMLGGQVPQAPGANGIAAKGSDEELQQLAKGLADAHLTGNPQMVERAGEALTKAKLYRLNAANGWPTGAAA